jgi:hypothetical protein
MTTCLLRISLLLACIESVCVTPHDKWVPVITVRLVLRLRMEGLPPDVEGSCEYMEQAVVDIGQGVVLQLGGWVSC